MTVSAIESIAVFSGNGVTTQFPYTFPVREEEALRVYILRSGFELVELGPSEYTDNAGEVIGGVVTYSPSSGPLAVGDILVIRRAIPYTQETAIANQQKYYANVVEATFDRIVMQIQQLAEEVSRAVRVPPGQSLDNLGAILTRIQQWAAEAKGYRDESYDILTDMRRAMMIPIWQDEIAVLVSIGSLYWVGESDSPYPHVTLEMV